MERFDVACDSKINASDPYCCEHTCTAFPLTTILYLIETRALLNRIGNESEWGIHASVKDRAKGNFKDLNGSYAASEIKAVAQAGIISGKGDRRFDPKSNATRAEALQIILNVPEFNPQLKKLLNSLSCKNPMIRGAGDMLVAMIN